LVNGRNGKSQVIEPITATYRYNRSGRVWEMWPGPEQEYEAALVGGEVICFPAGDAGKRGAMLACLTRRDAAVAAVVESLIAARPDDCGWIDRVLRAGFIVCNGDVLLAPKRNYITVRSQNPTKQGTEYLVQNRGMVGWFCQCRDWREGREARFYADRAGAPTVRGLGTMCKHALAVLISKKLGRIPEAL
jgi:hypothetical protein